ncbi:MAG: lipid-A-disaccharide synthase [Bacteroidetes bacterium]|nr:lipid-A-disaccharide synthase [Bacteroidota bacterium]
MKYYIVAGEPSGDMYGAKIMQIIMQEDSEAEFRIWGGDKMERMGGTQVSHIRERAFMGIWEVIMNLRKIKRNFKLFKDDFIRYKPDALILIDYPGFNLRIAPIAKNMGIPVHFYIAPKVWAWNKKRIKDIKAYVDYLYTILPFEPAFFNKYQIESDYVGNPLVDLISEYQPDTNIVENLCSGKPVIALLPGSRKMEIANILPILASVPKHFQDYRFVMAGSDSFSQEELNLLSKKYQIEILRGKTYEILSVATAALVTSGTATLETGLWNVPQVVCYKFSKISYLIVKPLMRVKYISLVNLILDSPLVKELIQDELTESNAKNELDKILNTDKRKAVLTGYAALKIKVGDKGASERVAKMIVQRTRKN